MTDYTDDQTPQEAPTQIDEDPAAPQSSDEQTIDLAEAVQLANGLESDEKATELSFDEGPVPTIEMDWARAAAFYTACINANPRVGYGLGAKIPGDGAKPGTDFKKVDCSGFVRAIIRRSSTPLCAFPDGSVVQHDWVRARGFAPLPRSAAATVDNKVRIAFLAPSDSPQGIGHVVLLRNGHTLESHGGTGPNRRPWTGAGWQAKASVYMIDPT